MHGSSSFTPPSIRPSRFGYSYSPLRHNNRNFGTDRPAECQRSILRKTSLESSGTLMSYRTFCTSWFHLQGKCPYRHHIYTNFSNETSSLHFEHGSSSVTQQTEYHNPSTPSCPTY